MLRGLLRILMRLGVLLLVAGGLLLGWRAALHYGPSHLPGHPALFGFHTRLLLKAEGLFPRPIPGVLLPAPRPMSSADVQLRLMKWRDGGAWLPDALALGEAEKGGLRLRAGRIILEEVGTAGPVEGQDGDAICRVPVRVRWEFPEGLDELLRVREIVDLRLPKGLKPGASQEMVLTFRRAGWHWNLVSAQPGSLEPKPEVPAWVEWVL